MSGADSVGDNGKASADGKEGRARTPMAQTGLWARTEVAGYGYVGMDVSGRYWYVGVDATVGIVWWARS
jgi:hypothetical protein